MPDWRQLVNEHLAALVLDPHERAEVIEELADHLDKPPLICAARDLQKKTPPGSFSAKSAVGVIYVAKFNPPEERKTP